MSKPSNSKIPRSADDYSAGAVNQHQAFIKDQTGETLKHVAHSSQTLENL